MILALSIELLWLVGDERGGPRSTLMTTIMIMCRKGRSGSNSSMIVSRGFGRRRSSRMLPCSIACDMLVPIGRSRHHLMQLCLINED